MPEPSRNQWQPDSTCHSESMANRWRTQTQTQTQTQTYYSPTCQQSRSTVVQSFITKSKNRHKATRETTTFGLGK